MKNLLVFLILLCDFSLYGADKPEYNASLIPSTLLKNAKAIVRSEKLEIEINENNAVENHFKAITILNKNGYELSIFQQFCNSFIKISDVNVTIYDAAGKKVKSYFGSDIKDYSAISGFSLYEDNRQQYFDSQYRTYPFTVEFSYKRKVKSLMFLPSWVPCIDYNCSVEKSILSVIVNEGATIRYFESNIPQTAKIEEINHKKSYTWSINNLTAFSKEEFESPFLEFMPVVYLSPLEFEVDGIKGSFASWEEFGKWIIKLNSERDTLSSATVKKLQELTKGLSTTEKIEKIYDYMQKHTRYVSIQVGIGGWQPFDALTVDRLAYGDCKALSNYTYSLLKAVGIPSYFTLIYGGENAANILTEFPSQFFNHAILIVPVENDTLFLECTNQYVPCGYIGSFTDNRSALMITNNGGKLIKTKSYNAEENIVSTKNLVTLNKEGSGNSLLIRSYSGVNYLEAKMLSLKSNDDIKKELYNKLNISNYTINDFAFKQCDEKSPVMQISMHLDIDHYATIVNNKMLIPLNFSNRKTDIPNISEDRKSKILIRRPQTEIDSVEFKIPEGYSIDQLPKEINIPSTFAFYDAKCLRTSDRSVIYIRKISFNNGVFLPNESSKFKEFFTQVSRADMVRLSISKSDQTN